MKMNQFAELISRGQGQVSEAWREKAEREPLWEQFTVHKTILNRVQSIPKKVALKMNSSLKKILKTLRSNGESKITQN